MIRRIALAAVLALPACTWSNSLYHARRLSKEAIQFEQDNRPFEAASAWGRAAVKADTAYARNPAGDKGAEALWLRGRGRARSGDCPGAITSLERALTAAPAASWREPLLLELGTCLARAGDPRAVQHFRELENSTDPAIRRSARLSSGENHVRAGEWAEALASLQGIDGESARTQRAIALAGLRRMPEAMLEVQPLLATRDTARSWTDVVTAFAGADPASADSVMARLQATGSVTGPRLGALAMAAAQGASATNAAYADRQLQQVAGTRDPSLSGQGKLMIAEGLVARSTTPAQLRVALDSLRRLATDDGPSALRFAAFGRITETVLTQHDSVAAGAPLGDMLTFLHAETARDTLKSPALARYFFSRLERDWPTSPYVPKALLARIAAEPDSADALRARLQLHADSPYLAYLQGRETERFAELETALQVFAQVRRARGGVPLRPRGEPGAASQGVEPR